MATIHADPSAVPVWALAPGGRPIPATDPEAALAEYWCLPGDKAWRIGKPPGVPARPAARPSRPAGPILPGADAPAPHGRGTRR